MRITKKAISYAIYVLGPGAPYKDIVAAAIAYATIDAELRAWGRDYRSQRHTPPPPAFTDGAKNKKLKRIKKI